MQQLQQWEELLVTVFVFVLSSISMNHHEGAGVACFLAVVMMKPVLEN
jgi:hypothetical protein